MTDDTRRDCPGCKLPNQHVGLPCGFCNKIVPSLSRGADEFFNIGPAQTREVIGWRAWVIRRDPDGTPALYGPVIGNYKWEPGVWLTAEHNGFGRKGRSKPDAHGRIACSPDSTHHDDWPPVEGCACGFYAGRTREHLISLGYGRDPNHSIIGEVEMKGKIILASNGFRAQQVRARKLCIPYEHWELANELTAKYGPSGVEVELSTTVIMPKAEALEWCPKCNAAMERKTICGLCGYHHQG